MSNHHDAVVLLFKHSAGKQGEIVSDPDGSLVKSGMARPLVGNQKWKESHGEIREEQSS